MWLTSPPFKHNLLSSGCWVLSGRFGALSSTAEGDGPWRNRTSRAALLITTRWSQCSWRCSSQTTSSLITLVTPSLESLHTRIATGRMWAGWWRQQGGGSMSWARGIPEGQQSPTPSLLSTIKRTVFTIKGYIKYKKNGHLLAFKQKNGAAFDYWAHYTIIQLAAY